MVARTARQDAPGPSSMHYAQAVGIGWKAGSRTLAEVHVEHGRMQHTVQQWSKEEFGSMTRQLTSMRDKLEKDRANYLWPGPTTRSVIFIELHDLASSTKQPI
jgi:hypothetical protein